MKVVHERRRRVQLLWRRRVQVADEALACGELLALLVEEGQVVAGALEALLPLLDGVLAGNGSQAATAEGATNALAGSSKLANAEAVAAGQRLSARLTWAGDADADLSYEIRSA